MFRRCVTASAAKLFAVRKTDVTVLLCENKPIGATKAKSPLLSGLFAFIGSLAVCYSRMASATLPSPQLRFTSEFGMESGGSTALLPPGIKLVVCSLIQ